MSFFLVFCWRRFSKILSFSHKIRYFCRLCFTQISASSFESAVSTCIFYTYKMRSSWIILTCVCVCIKIVVLIICANKQYVGAFSYVSHVGSKRRQNTNTLMGWRKRRVEKKCICMKTAHQNQTQAQICAINVRTLNVCINIVCLLLCCFVTVSYSVFFNASRPIGECYLCLNRSMCNYSTNIVRPLRIV